MLHVCKTNLEREYEYEVEYQPELYGPSPQADTQPDTRADTRQSAPFEVGLILLYLILNMSKYTRLINVIYFDHVTRFLCSDWLKCHITLQCDTVLVITLSVSALH